MGRKRLRMELISDEKERRITFQKKRKTLEKKAAELSTLCRIKVGMIMYGPTEGNNPVKEPVIWPENRQDVSFLIDSYRSDHENCKNRACNVSTFLNKHTEKVDAEIKKASAEDVGVKYPKWDEKLDYLSREELEMFGNKVSAKIDVLKLRISELKKRKNVQQPKSLFKESDFLVDPFGPQNSVKNDWSDFGYAEEDNQFGYMNFRYGGDDNHFGNSNFGYGGDENSFGNFSGNMDFCDPMKLLVPNGLCY